ncbi:hypothetical protein [Streptosporangium sp. NPDC051022]|uniref:hypothetical protein n=1 Tax=Streptosporangium sp. NPDC051022 TaxID=3155752 RepID=UPI003447E00D
MSPVPKAGPDGGGVPLPSASPGDCAAQWGQIGEPTAAAWPEARPPQPIESLKPLGGRKKSRAQNPGPATGRRATAVRSDPPAPPASALSESGQMPQLWNDPNLRMPLAAPTPVVSPSPGSIPGSTADAQPLGAPLPRDVDGPGQEVEPVALSEPFLTGTRGFPMVGASVGGLLGLLWLQAKIQRRRGTRPVL